jgi:peroxiredoxin
MGAYRTYRILTLLLAFAGGLTACGGPPSAAARPSAAQALPPEPSALSAIVLAAPAEPAARHYLGLATESAFRLDAVKTRILVIEVFSMYCPHCQREAPSVNRLYHTIQSDPRLREGVKLIGIGIGNTAYEVDIFRQTYEVPFPLFADSERLASGQLQVRSTPTFVAFAFDPDGTVRQFHHSTGSLGDVTLFLERLVEASELEALQQP